VPGFAGGPFRKVEVGTSPVPPPWSGFIFFSCFLPATAFCGAAGVLEAFPAAWCPFSPVFFLPLFPVFDRLLLHWNHPDIPLLMTGPPPKLFSQSHFTPPSSCPRFTPPPICHAPDGPPGFQMWVFIRRFLAPPPSSFFLSTGPAPLTVSQQTGV